MARSHRVFWLCACALVAVATLLQVECELTTPSLHSVVPATVEVPISHLGDKDDGGNDDSSQVSSDDSLKSDKSENVKEQEDASEPYPLEIVDGFYKAPIEDTSMTFHKENAVNTRLGGRTVYNNNRIKCGIVRWGEDENKICTQEEMLQRLYRLNQGPLTAFQDMQLKQEHIPFVKYNGFASTKGIPVWDGEHNKHTLYCAMRGDDRYEKPCCSPNELHVSHSCENWLEVSKSPPPRLIAAIRVGGMRHYKNKKAVLDHLQTITSCIDSLQIEVFDETDDSGLLEVASEASNTVAVISDQADLVYGLAKYGVATKLAIGDISPSMLDDLFHLFWNVVNHKSDDECQRLSQDRPKGQTLAERCDELTSCSMSLDDEMGETPLDEYSEGPSGGIGGVSSDMLSGENDEGGDTPSDRKSEGPETHGQAVCLSASRITTSAETGIDWDQANKYTQASHLDNYEMMSEMLKTYRQISEVMGPKATMMHRSPKMVYRLLTDKCWRIATGAVGKENAPSKPDDEYLKEAIRFYARLQLSFLHHVTFQDLLSKIESQLEDIYKSIEDNNGLEGGKAYVALAVLAAEGKSNCWFARLAEQVVRSSKTLRGVMVIKAVPIGAEAPVTGLSFFLDPRFEHYKNIVLLDDFALSGAQMSDLVHNVHDQLVSCKDLWHRCHGDYHIHPTPLFSTLHARKVIEDRALVKDEFPEFSLTFRRSYDLRSEEVLMNEAVPSPEPGELAPPPRVPYKGAAFDAQFIKCIMKKADTRITGSPFYSSSWEGGVLMVSEWKIVDSVSMSDKFVQGLITWPVQPRERELRVRAKIGHRFLPAVFPPYKPLRKLPNLEENVGSCLDAEFLKAVEEVGRTDAPPSCIAQFTKDREDCGHARETDRE